MSRSGNCPPPAERVVFYAARTARHGLKSMNKKAADRLVDRLQFMERATGFEPATSTLARWRATNCAKPA